MLGGSCKPHGGRRHSVSSEKYTFTWETLELPQTGTCAIEIYSYGVNRALQCIWTLGRDPMGVWRREDEGSSQWPKSTVSRKNRAWYEVFSALHRVGSWMSRSDCLYTVRNGHNLAPPRAEMIGSVQVHCGHLRLGEVNPALGVPFSHPFLKTVAGICTHWSVLYWIQSVCFQPAHTASGGNVLQNPGPKYFALSYSQPLQILYVII